MPTAAEGLSKSSSDEQIRDAISSCISQLTKEKKGDQGWPRDRIIATCHSMAERATGKRIRRSE